MSQVCPFSVRTTLVHSRRRGLSVSSRTLSVPCDRAVYQTAKGLQLCLANPLPDITASLSQGSDSLTLSCSTQYAAKANLPPALNPILPPFSKYALDVYESSQRTRKDVCLSDCVTGNAACQKTQGVGCYRTGSECQLEMLTRTGRIKELDIYSNKDQYNNVLESLGLTATRRKMHRPLGTTGDLEGSSRHNDCIARQLCQFGLASQN